MSEYRPTEYVVDFGDYRSNQFVRLNMALIEQNGAKLHERIVRCKDCKHYGCEWVSKEVTPYFKACYRLHAIEFMVEPDGYCAWGERRQP